MALQTMLERDREERVAPTATHPRTIGRYEIQEEIGRGMMGVVYRALDPNLGRELALKTVQLAFAVSEQERETFAKRFLAEARAVAALSHPGIVVVHDAGRDSATGTLFIALEYLQGQTLAQLTACEPLDWREAARLTARVAEALHHAHSKGFVHRDVKPANIMVLPSGEPKVMDFGIAKIPAEQLTSTGQFFGTPAYMSPEQASAEVLDGRSDVFSLGAVLYLLLTGRAAFEAEGVPAVLSRILFQDPVPPSQLVAGLPSALDRIVARALAKRPSERYSDAKALAQDLQDVLGGREPPPGPAAAPSLVDANVVLRADAAPSALGQPSAGAPSWLGGLSTRIGRRGFLALGSVLAVGLVAIVFGSSAAKVKLPLVPTVVPPAQLEIDLRHSLKSGTLRVWIDDALKLEEPLESWVKEDLLVLKVRSGREKKTLEIAPGEHEVRVQVTGDGYSGSRRIRAQFDTGATRRLEANFGGLLKKELTVYWGS